MLNALNQPVLLVLHQSCRWTRTLFMSWLSRLFGLLAVALFLIALCGCQGLVRGVSGLTVTLAGAGTGTVTSSPTGISCPGTCSGTFTNVSQITLTATPATGFGFAGWSG